MLYTIELLLSNPEVADWYLAAKQHWQESLARINAEDAHEIAEVASLQQAWFEQNCGGRFIGQEIMVVAGIGLYYSTRAGFGEDLDKAKSMYNGLRGSTCSTEIHAHANSMVNIFPELEER